VLAPKEVRNAFKKAAGMDEEEEPEAQAAAAAAEPEVEPGKEPGRKPVTEEDDCPVCYEALETDYSKLTWYVWGLCCLVAYSLDPPTVSMSRCTTCGNNVHTECLTQWNSQKIKNGGTPDCMYCRAPWPDKVKKAAAAQAGAGFGYGGGAAAVPAAAAARVGGYINVAGVAGIDAHEPQPYQPRYNYYYGGGYYKKKQNKWRYGWRADDYY
jgi:hypothetical protein